MENNSIIHIIFCRGLIASGKTSWSKLFVKNNQSYKRISRDDLRHMLSSYTYDEANENVVNFLYKNMLKTLIVLKYNVVIDDQNLNSERVLELQKEMNEFVVTNFPNIRLNFTFKNFAITKEEAILRDSKRQFIIGEKVITDTWNKYEDILLQLLENEVK